MTRRGWLTFARLFQDSKWALVLSFVLAVAQSALLIPVAVVVRHVFDRLIPHGDSSALISSGALILGLYLASAALGLATRYIVTRAGKAAIARLRTDLAERVYGFPREYFDRRELGVLHSTVVQDSERVDVMSNFLVAQLLPAAIVAVGLSAMLIVLNVVLFLVLACVVPILIGVGKLLGDSVRTRTRIWQRAFDVFSSEWQLALRAMSLTKVQGAEEIELRRRDRQVRDLSAAGLGLSWAQGAYGIVQGAVAASAGVIVLVVGGRAVARGDMSLGELLSFYAIVALLLRQVNTILSVIPLVMAGTQSLARLEAILASDEPQPYSGGEPHDFEGGLTLDDVTFGYGKDPVLRGVSLSVSPGERIAIVGPNGAGKSTLLSLILALYRPTGGRLLADGVPYQLLDVVALRRSMGVVLQDPVIFPGSVRENIAYGRADVTEEDIRRAAAWATADAFIESLPDGYDTRAGDEGGLLSGGQRQRIAIARALIGRPALLILDEPTTHLDDASIAQLMANLRRFPGAPSLVMISHDMEVAREADRVYFLRDGQIVGMEEPDARPAAVAAGEGVG